MKIEEMTSYRLVEKKKIEDLNSMSYLLEHKKSGARIALLSNDDENKVFYIGFRTPPEDSTGVAHILEHSVLEGSRDFFFIKGDADNNGNAEFFADCI